VKLGQIAIIGWWECLRRFIVCTSPESK